MLRTAYSQILNSSRDFSTAVVRRRGRGSSRRPSTCPSTWARCRGRCSRSPTSSGAHRARATSTCSTIPTTAATTCPTSPCFVPVFVGERLAVLVDQPRAPERHRRRHPRGLQPGRDRDLAGGHPHHAAQALRRGRAARRRDGDDRHQRAPPARLPGRPARHDRLGARRRAAAPQAGRRVRARDRHGGRRTRSSTAPSARAARASATWKDGVYQRRGHPRRRRARHHATSTSAPRSPRRATRSPSTSPTRTRRCIGFVNSSFPNTMSAVHMALAYLIDPRTPKNEGTFRPVEVKAKQGTIVWPFPPAPVTLATNHCAQEIAESDHQGARPEPAPTACSRAGRGASASRSRARTRARSASSSGTSSTRAAAAAPPPRATGGRPPAKARRRAASSSAASRWRRRAFRSSSSATSSAPTRSATGSTAAAWARC